MNANEFPRVSIVLLAYNQEALVSRAAAACLAQDCPPIEIVMSDDASTDGTYARLQECAAGYHGPHRVVVRRNERNVGIGEHYNQLLDIAGGELIVTAAGDDVCTTDRVRRLVEAWQSNGRRADLIASHVVDMAPDGSLHEVIRVDDLGPYKGVDDWVRERPYIIGASHAYTRRMMERFGPMDKAIAYEDQIMVFRAIVTGGAITVDAALVHYQRGGTSARPRFSTTKQMDSWNDRQLRRMLAEMRQLVADARIAGCEAPVTALLLRQMKHHAYVLGMRESKTLSERWRLLEDAAPLPFAWRFRKVLHMTFPNATRIVKGSVQIFHRRYWRARREQRSMQ